MKESGENCGRARTVSWKSNTMNTNQGWEQALATSLILVAGRLPALGGAGQSIETSQAFIGKSKPHLVKNDRA